MRPEILLSECSGRVIQEVVLGNNALLPDSESPQAVILFTDGHFATIAYEEGSHSLVERRLNPLNFGDTALIKAGVLGASELQRMRVQKLAREAEEHEREQERLEKQQLERLLEKHLPQVLWMVRGDGRGSSSGGSHGS